MICLDFIKIKDCDVSVYNMEDLTLKHFPYIRFNFFNEVYKSLNRFLLYNNCNKIYKTANELVIEVFNISYDYIHLKYRDKKYIDLFSLSFIKALVIIAYEVFKYRYEDLSEKQGKVVQSKLNILSLLFKDYLINNKEYDINILRYVCIVNPVEINKVSFLKRDEEFILSVCRISPEVLKYLDTSNNSTSICKYIFVNPECLHYIENPTDLMVLTSIYVSLLKNIDIDFSMLVSDRINLFIQELFKR